jgi:hypothetical protein
VTHGTRAAYQAGCTCVGCRAAEAAYRARLRRQHRLKQLPLGTIVSAVDTWKRIRALKAERVSASAISRRLGLRRGGLALHADRVTLKNALKVRLLCRALLMGPRDA